MRASLGLLVAVGTLVAGCAGSGDPRVADFDRYKADSTSVPTDVVGLPGEFEPVDQLIVSWAADAAIGRMTFSNAIIKAAAEQSRVLVIPSLGADQPGDLTAAMARAMDTFTKAGVNLGNVSFAKMPTNSIWMRDYGPEVVRTTSGTPRVIDTVRDANGDLEAPDDDVVPSRLGKILGFPVSHSSLNLMGGNVQSDGQGRCITSSTVLDDNETMKESALRSFFQSYFGCRSLSILAPLKDEETGHVDIEAYITGPGKILVGQCDPAEDPENAAILDAAAKRVADDGFAVTRLPMPKHEALAQLGEEENPVFPSYTNAAVVNDVVLVPTFAQDRTHEAEALDLFRAAFPDRTVVPIDATEMVKLGGAVHCATMTLAKPAAAPR